MRLERSELQALVEVIEAGGFNKAAQRLSLSQSAVSQAVAGLENKLGTQLVLRGRKPELSRAGRRLYDYAQQVLHGEQLLLSDLESMRHSSQPPLSLAMNSMLTRHYAASLLSAFCAQHSHIALQIQELPSRQIISAVIAGEVELGFGPFQTHMEAFELLPLFKEERLLVVSANHPRAEQILNGDKEALRDSVLIASYLDQPEQRPGQSRIRDNFSGVWQIASLRLRLSLLAQGKGVAYVNTRLLAEDPLCRDLQAIPGLPISVFYRDVGLFYQKGRLLTASAQRFIQHCKEYWL